MSEISYSGFLSSKPFLVLGPNKTLFYTHSNLLAQCSPVLSKSVNGEMREKQLETIEIEDVDGDIDDDTVMRFIEYAYRGDYTVPSPDILQLSTDPKELQEAFVPNRTPVSDDDGLNDWSLSGKTARKSKKEKKGKKARKGSVETKDSLGPSYPLDLSEPIDDSYPDGPAPSHPLGLDEPIDDSYPEQVLGPAQSYHLDSSEPIDDSYPKRVPGPALLTVNVNRRKQWDKFCSLATVISQTAWQPPANNDEREDYTVVFLCHARLYKFSDRYSCEKLMDLALQKLRLTLTRYIFHKERASDVIELIRYTYSHTLDSDRRCDRLRALVLDYTTCYFRELMQDLSFVKLLQEGGSLPSDLMAEVAAMVS